MKDVTAWLGQALWRLRAIHKLNKPSTPYQAVRTPDVTRHEKEVHEANPDE